MILLDSDVLIDLFRGYPPATEWFDNLSEDDVLIVSGFVAMELIQGCRNKKEQERVQSELTTYGVVWPSQADCDKALKMFASYHLSHGIGLLDVLISQTALALDVPLCTFNQKHYSPIADIQTYQPYKKF